MHNLFEELSAFMFVPVIVAAIIVFARIMMSV